MSDFTITTRVLDPAQALPAIRRAHKAVQVSLDREQAVVMLGTEDAAWLLAMAIFWLNGGQDAG